MIAVGIVSIVLSVVGPYYWVVFSQCIVPFRHLFLADFLALATRRGLPLADGLEAFAREQRGRFALAVQVVGEEVKAGSTLWEAMNYYPERFPKQLHCLIRIGEATGTLPEMLEGYAAQEQEAVRNREKVLPLLVYPLFPFLFFVVFELFFAVKIAPQYKTMFEDMDLDLPKSTFRFFQFTDFIFRDNWSFSFVLMTIGLGLFILFLFPGSALRFFPGLRRDASSTAFCQALAILLKANVPVSQAVSYAAQVGGVEGSKKAMARIEAAVADGQKFSEVLSRELRLSRSDSWKLSLADGRGEFPQALREVAQDCQYRSSRRILVLTKIVVPILVFLQGLLVLFTAVAFFAPLEALIGRLGG